MTFDLADADPVARILAWCRGHTAVLAAFGGPDHVSGQNKAPYPHLRIAPSAGGTDLDLRTLIAPEVAVEVYGDLDRTQGYTALRALAYTAVRAITDLVETVPGTGEAVIVGVRSSSAVRWSPEAGTGQPAVRTTLIVHTTPPQH